MLSQPRGCLKLQQWVPLGSGKELAVAAPAPVCSRGRDTSYLGFPSMYFAHGCLPLTAHAQGCHAEARLAHGDGLLGGQHFCDFVMLWRGGTVMERCRWSAVLS